MYRLIYLEGTKMTLMPIEHAHQVDAEKVCQQFCKTAPLLGQVVVQHTRTGKIEASYRGVLLPAEYKAYLIKKAGEEKARGVSREH